eukprot:gnl/Hemi2/20332_TR6750_c0_g1_i1.p1 gnl/Hemi2/20332_TR6750_c0_g1~~gnl/Hemi2/20332_TR6750_c0_g1_i1.p1  ORF type:complete len:184 (+),score=36.40 gnl/Hemi2/20332_TR6750_c0_g1_i1:145-696(+)
MTSSGNSPSTQPAVSARRDASGAAFLSCGAHKSHDQALAEILDQSNTLLAADPTNAAFRDRLITELDYYGVPPPELEKPPPVVVGFTMRGRGKEPNAPKLPMSPYFFFVQERRPLVSAENPGLMCTEIAKRLGGLWHGLSDAEKQPYQQRAEADRERYKVEMQAYTPPAAATTQQQADSETDE